MENGDVVDGLFFKFLQECLLFLTSRMH